MIRQAKARGQLPRKSGDSYSRGIVVLCCVEKRRMEERDVKIQVASGEYPDKRLWLELPISDDPDWIKTTATRRPIGQRTTSTFAPVPGQKVELAFPDGAYHAGEVSEITEDGITISRNDGDYTYGAGEIMDIKMICY